MGKVHGPVALMYGMRRGQLNYWQRMHNIESSA
jgi:hypothetical protein